MKFFEIVMFIVSVLNFILFSLSGIKRKAIVGLGFVTLVLIFLHTFLEGYRWPMLPLYLIIGIQLLVMLFRRGPAFSVVAKRSKSHLFKRGVLGLLIFTPVFLLPSYLFPTFKLPEPTGPYSVGTQTLHLIDPSRAEQWSKEQPYRELVIQMWYPTDEQQGTQAPYHSHGKQLTKDLESTLGLPAFFLQSIEQAQTSALLEPSLSRGELIYPVLLYSHGLGGYRTQSTFQMIELASQGYIVAAIDHAYYSPGTVFPDGQAIGVVTTFMEHTKKEDMDRYVEEWSADARFVLNELEAINHGKYGTLFTGRLDVDRIGYLGHSLGGATASQTLARDSRFNVGVNLDGFPYGDAHRSGIEQPFMNILADVDLFELTEAELAYLGMTQEQYQVDVLDEMLVRMESHNQGRNIVMIEATRHLDFSDFPLLSPATRWFKMTGELDTRRLHQITNAIIIDFLNVHLKGESFSVLVEDQNVLPELMIKGSFQ